MQLFYTPDISGDTYKLNEEESKHIVRVLRLKCNDTLTLTDGKGSMFKAQIINDNPKGVIVSIIEHIKNFEKRNYKLILAVAPTKNIDRFEWFIEKATEIGVDKIVPLLCEHSERKCIKNERVEKIITSAVKQSLKAYHPELSEMCRFKDFVKSQLPEDRFIAHCEEEKDKVLLKNVIELKKDVVILIGPEGDFTKEEITLARENGFRDVSLGNSRLRTETAAVVACHTVALINE